MRTFRPTRTRLLACLTVLLSIALTVAAAEYLLRRHAVAIARSDQMDPGMIVFDDTLGWKLQRHWRGTHRHADYAVDYQTNGLGFRGSLPALESSRTVPVLGDSFTFGLGVGAGETFVERLDQLVAPYRFLNFGVPGYSTDQQLLQLRAVLEQHTPALVLWVVYLGNDLLDNRHPFTLQADYAKPYFEIEDGRLELRNVPVPLQRKHGRYLQMTLGSEVLGDASVMPRWRKLLARSQIGQRVNALLGVDQQALARHLETHLEGDLALFLAVIEEGRLMLREKNIDLAIVLLSGAGHIEQPRSLAHTYQAYLLRELARRLRDSRVPVIDVASDLLRAQGGDPLYFPQEGHLTRRGHASVAASIAAALPRIIDETGRPKQSH